LQENLKVLLVQPSCLNQ